MPHVKYFARTLGRSDHTVSMELAPLDFTYSEDLYSTSEGLETVKFDFSPALGENFA